jgi:ubiquinone/menaquinone biosynthesis C-methylase UbiE
MENNTEPGRTALDAYDGIAERYDQHADSSAHNAYCERPAMIDLMPEGLDGCSALDAGCGTGFYSGWLADRGAAVTAFDGSHRMVALAKEKLEDQVTIRQHDLASPLDFLEAEHFDLAVCALVFDHIQDLSIPLAEFHRVLKPSGVLLFSMGHPTHDFVKLGQNYFQTERVEERFPNLGVTMSYYRRSVSGILSPLLDSGFALERLVEPCPVDECRPLHPELFERLSKRPSFICIRARRASSRIPDVFQGRIKHA